MFKKLFQKSNVILLIIFLVMILTAVYLTTKLKYNDVNKKIEEGKNIITLITLNDGKNLIFSEVFIYNPVTRKAALLDIPVNYGSLFKSADKIAAIDTLYKRHKIEDFQKKIQEETNLKIDYYIDMSLEEMSRIVDLIDGVEIFIVNPVENLTGDSLKIILPAGFVILDGDKVLEYILQNEQSDSYELRIKGHYQLMQSFIKKIGEKKDFLLNENVFPQLCKNIDTNLSQKGSLKNFIAEMKNINCDSMVLQSVAGEFKVVDERKLIFPHKEGRLFRNLVEQILNVLSDERIVENFGVSIDVLNGTFISGFAGRTAEYLKNMGCSVAAVRNANFTEEYEKTIIIGNKNDFDTVQKFAHTISCKNVVFIQDSPEILDREPNCSSVNITLILGKDFDGKYCK